MSQTGKEGKLLSAPLETLSTPALVLDIEALDRNLKLMAGYFSVRACRLRPHFKSHKCVALARRQLAAGGAVGMTCAKVAEAEHLVEGGLRDVLIANQVIGPDKTARVARLNRRARVRVAVDSVTGIEQLGRAAAEAGVTVGALVEVDLGMGRCGVPPGVPALELARRVAGTPGLRFDGLQGYEGHLVTLPDYEERRQRVTQAMHMLIETRGLIQSDGLAVEIVSAGGTGTYDITGVLDWIDEIQCGSYALMDAAYKKVRPEFENARTVLATVISARRGRAVADVGLKGMGCEYALPVVVGYPEARTLYVAEEHTVIENIEVRVGDKISLIPPHGCTTNNLYDRMWVARRGVLEEVWDIEGRGCLE